MPMLFVCVLALWMCGCQSNKEFAFLPGYTSSLVRTSTDETRFSDREEESTPTTTVLKEEAAANYGSLQSRFEGSTTAPASGKPGHAFLQPKARLGRPVPLPQQVVTPSQQPSDSGKTDVDGRHDDLKSDAGTTLQDTTSSTRTASPWISGTQAWQPGTPSTDGTTRPGFKAKPSSSEAKQKSSMKTRGFPEELTGGQADVETDDEPIDNGAFQPIPGDSESAEESALPPEEASSVTPDAASDNSMLGRLRSFYPPRLDAGTDRIRKQFRRLPDPFGILKEREPLPSEAETSTAEIPTVPNHDTSTPEPLRNELPANTVPENASPATPMEAAIRQIEEELAAWPRTGSGQPERLDEWRRRQTDLRLMLMVAGRTAESTRMVESLPVDEQEYWQSMMLSMNHFRDSDPTTPRRMDLTEALSHLRTAGRRLQPLAALEIQRLMFCSRIDGFGRVTQFPTADFEPGQRILLYAGLRNFRSELTADGKFRTEFAAEIEFRRVGDDEVMETIRLPQILDECDEERTDYYQSFELTAPALAGDYVVRIKLVDQLSVQTAQSELQLSIH